jgi:uncharacterized tellurite resistance protein B-like protein
VDEDFGLDELKLAFSYHIVNQIVDADGVVAPSEATFLRQTFPRALFEHADFVDKERGVFTERWREALGEALLVLPTRSREERLGVIRTLLDAALSDADFAHEEGQILQRAARLLALDPGDVGEMVDALVSNEVTLDTTVDTEEI